MLNCVSVWLLKDDEMASYCHSKLYCDHVIFDIDVRLMECLAVAAKGR